MRTFLCCDARRRNAVRERPDLNGIDFLEVSEDQRTLFVHALHPWAPGAIGQDQVVVEGGERIRTIDIVQVVDGSTTSPPLSPPVPSPRVLAVTVAEPGDFSPYVLRLVRGPDDPRPPDGFDPILSAVEFTFKAACAWEVDCVRDPVCPPDEPDAPELDHLARDFNSFRRLMLDRMAARAPDWRDRNVADLGVTLVELVSFVGDYLAYQQDAVATEAYLGTARKRVSVRRHARLVDYRMHDGSNARTWIQLRAREGVSGELVRAADGGKVAQVLSGAPSLLDASGAAVAVVAFDSDAHARALDDGAAVFELLDPERRLDRRHNEMPFHTWGDEDCCLPKGATRATLRGDFTDLAVGEVVVLAERRGPSTGLEADADPTRRHAVRLTEVRLLSDPLLAPAAPGSPPGSPPPSPPTSPPAGGADAVTEIAWHPDDALPFPLCVSSRVAEAFFEDVSVALGNIVLADHGRTVPEPERVGPVPDARPELARIGDSASHCDDPAPSPWPPRFRPRLAGSPVTQAAPYDPDAPPPSAREAIGTWPAAAMPAAELVEDGRSWEPRLDLLDSGATARHFVVEVEDDGRAALRFGDDRFGSRPASGTVFDATYRVGNGTRGNVGANTLRHLVSADTGLPQVVESVWNPLPARGGTEPEPVEEVRQKAPWAFRTQERAVTADDYAEQAMRADPGLQRARATFRWTGSWRTAFLTVDRLGGADVTPDFERGLRADLERVRMAGHDLEVDGPRYVPLEVGLRICVARGYAAADVRQAVLERFGDRTLPGGGTGLFHPDRLTFGEPVHIGSLYAAAQAVPGVDSVEVVTFRRQDRPDVSGLASGRLDMGRLEVPRLDNDRDFPGRGVLTLQMEGGL